MTEAIDKAKYNISKLKGLFCSFSIQFKRNTQV